MTKDGGLKDVASQPVTIRMIRAILDVDAGVDEALAISLAFNSPEREVKALTTVSGNVHVDLCTKNVL